MELLLVGARHVDHIFSTCCDVYQETNAGFCLPGHVRLKKLGKAHVAFLPHGSERVFASACVLEEAEVKVEVL